MSEIKQINTGVAELLAVKVPEGITGWAIGNGCVYFNSVGVKLIPYGDYEALGLSTELTEEQCRTVVEKSIYIDDVLGRTEYYRDYSKDSIEESTLFTAKEAFASLMQANGCYSVNPFGTQPHNIGLLDLYPFGHPTMDAQLECARKWKEAESNTGRYLILKRLS